VNWLKPHLRLSAFGNFRLGLNELKAKPERYSPIRLVNAIPIKSQAIPNLHLIASLRCIDRSRQSPYDILKWETIEDVQKSGLTVFIMKGGWNE